MGAATIGLAELELKGKKRPKVAWHRTIPHNGNPKGELVKAFKKLDLSAYDGMAVTGRRFKDYVNMTRITEPRAIELALDFVKKRKVEYNALVTLGAENFLVYELSHNKIINVHTGNKCASGTGNFFLQQIDRMNLGVKEAVKLARKSKKIHAVSGRCSVFCKSDCTHALNKGVAKGEVTAGLCKMIANKIVELLAGVKKDKIILVGGVTQNTVVMEYLKEHIKHIDIPEEATYFEAIGAALYALDNRTRPLKDLKRLLVKGKSSFDFLEPLKKYEKLVSFKSFKQGKAKEGDVCILGLDVGSTTTKAVIMRVKDNAVLASIYLRTNGDPVGASRNCYAELIKQLPYDIRIIGLGSTGSGRHIAGLHALTKGVINEIIAHAKASVYFDPKVDTIFEIGGQDAKYTFLTNSVPSDYAMNEACSAGTGSFLEESAKETLGIDVTEIAGIAMKSKNPPNFNDQCAAFINSDIKNAISEGIEKTDIVAGLVYSICMNYNNRVKGSRTMGYNIFMQGGVCYNKAVPVAMAALTGKKITVPPEPGLMGSFGVALAIKERIELGLMEEQEFDLTELRDRDVEYGKSFTCKADKECDINCTVNMIKINDQNYAFGGACNRFYNQRLKIKEPKEAKDHIKERQKLVFEKYANIEPEKNDGRPTVGINRSFLMFSLYPLFYNFFNKLGYRVVLSDECLVEGMDKVSAPFCYPCHQAHGHLQNLIEKKPDHIFLPQIKEIYQKKSVSYKEHYNAACFTVQGETYILQSVFPEVKNKVLDPILNFRKGWGTQEAEFLEMAKQLGKSGKLAKKAYDFAVKQQRACNADIKKMGRRALKGLKKDKDRIALVVFGRPYNAFNPEGNLGIPKKLTSRGFEVIPFDALPFEGEDCENTMHWAMGQMITKAGHLVKKHPQLFGVYITNFSCGPDSFLLRYFREDQGKKPSLTLELDEHTADVGANTRLDAFLDIVASYRMLEKKRQIKEEDVDFPMPEVIGRNNNFFVKLLNGKEIPLQDDRIRLVIPSMGLISDAGPPVLKAWGVKAQRVEIPDFEVLRQGRANTSCKECLPLIVTTGSLLDYLEKNRKKNEIIVYFMPGASGGCRFGQYNVFLRRLIRRKKIPNTTVMTLDPDTGWSGFPMNVQLGLLKAFTVADCCYSILNATRALAVDREEGLRSFWKEWDKICTSLGTKNQKGFYKQLEKSVKEWSKMKIKTPIKDAKKIALTGEIFVRTCHFCKLDLMERLADEEIVALIAPTMEWFSFVNWRARKRIAKSGLSKKVMDLVKDKYVYKTQNRINKTLAKSKLYEYNPLDMEKIVQYGETMVRWQLGGDPVLTCGGALLEITHQIDGDINIGPFACMQSRIGEALMNQQFTYELKKKVEPDNKNLEKYKDFTHFPFLAIESDGNLFPPIINARLEAFALQVERMNKVRTGKD
jgi:predicted CoA-substrate-specific enzyme activase